MNGIQKKKMNPGRSKLTQETLEALNNEVNEDRNPQKEIFYNTETNHILRVVESKSDPLAPSKFKHKRAPRNLELEQVPVLSKSKKLTKEEKKLWEIPPCISNIKNPKGYTISIEHRMLADGNSRQEKGIGAHKLNNKHLNLAEALGAAAEVAREDSIMRAQILQRKFQSQQALKNDFLKAQAKELLNNDQKVNTKLKYESKRQYLQDKIKKKQ